jgi:hypothetical protein
MDDAQAKYKRGCWAENPEIAADRLGRLISGRLNQTGNL